MGRTRDVSKILTSNTSILTLASASSIYQTKASNALVLLNTTSFTAQSTVSIDNVFSETYDNYRVTFNFTGTAAHRDRLRFRVSSADNTTSNYSTQRLRASNTESTASRPQSGGNNADLYGNEGQPAIGEKDFFVMEIQFPFITNKTFFQSIYNQDGNFMIHTSGAFTSTTSFTGFSIIPSAGNITGSIVTYGYNK
jgi:hypothetical protein